MSRQTSLELTYMEVILIINEVTVDLRGTFRAKLLLGSAVSPECGILEKWKKRWDTCS